MSAPSPIFSIRLLGGRHAAHDQTLRAAATQPGGDMHVRGRSWGAHVRFGSDVWCWPRDYFGRQSRPELEAPMTAHEDGIWFGLQEDEYHNDLALGSSDMKKLAFSPPDYWFGSPMNPARKPQEQTDALKFGKAMHLFVLEGPALFKAAYAPTEYPGNIKAGIKERKQIAEEGKEPLKADEWERVQLAGTMIRSNPHIGRAFRGGEPEVSIFWTSPAGIRKKCRIDYLKPKATVDLKSIRVSRNIPFPEACRRAIAEFRYDLQAEHYREGRVAARQLFADGAVTGDHDRGLLAAAMAEPDVPFVFVFYKAEGAPLTYGTVISPGSPILEGARIALDRADANYLEFMGKFGADLPWVLDEPLNELDMSEMPAWFFRT
jgi:hypothetical protein